MRHVIADIHSQLLQKNLGWSLFKPDEPLHSGPQHYIICVKFLPESQMSKKKHPIYNKCSCGVVRP